MPLLDEGMVVFLKVCHDLDLGTFLSAKGLHEGRGLLPKGMWAGSQVQLESIAKDNRKFSQCLVPIVDWPCPFFGDIFLDEE